MRYCPPLRTIPSGVKYKPVRLLSTISSVVNAIHNGCPVSKYTKSASKSSRPVVKCSSTAGQEKRQQKGEENAAA